MREFNEKVEVVGGEQDDTLKKKTECDEDHSSIGWNVLS